MAAVKVCQTNFSNHSYSNRIWNGIFTVLAGILQLVDAMYAMVSVSRSGKMRILY